MDDYKTSNLEIVKICEHICDTPLIQIKPNFAYHLHDFENHLSEFRYEVTVNILKMIRDIMNYMIVVYEGFEQYMHVVSIGSKTT